MQKVDEKLFEHVENHKVITKEMVLQLMEQHGAFNDNLSEKGKERIYKKFKSFFGWSWRTLGKTRCFTPSDIEQRIRNWSRGLYVQNSVRNYAYVLFGDETSLIVDNESHSKSLAPKGLSNMKIAETNPNP